jgi:hypothetical protein
MINKKIFIVLVLFLLSCKYKEEIELPIKSILTIDKEKYITILDRIELKELKDTKKANLNSKDIDEIDKILNEIINEHNLIQEKKLPKYQSELNDYTINKNSLTIDFKKYKRQYIPYLNKESEKEIWIYCLCDSHGSDYWKKEVLFTAGGGNCYFSVIINLADKSYRNFLVNGPA